MFRRGFLFFVLLAVAPPASAQGVPPHNPIFLSVTGTNAEPVIFRDVSLSTYDLLTGSVQFEKTDSSAKATFAPFKLREEYKPWQEVAFNLSQAKGVTTLGVGAAYNPRSAFSDAAAKDLQGYLAKIKTFRNQRADENADEYDALRAAYYKAQWFGLFKDFYKDLAKGAWILSAAANVQTFGTLAGDRVDVDQDGKFDNFYKQKGYDISGTFLYSWSDATTATVSGHFGKKRQSAVEGQTLETYPGFSAAFARRVKTFNSKDDEYTKTDDYLKSLFIPGVTLGASFERQKCGGDAASCQDALESQYALTPFVEIRVTPAAQFRIGVPVQRTVTFGKTSKVALAPALQLVVQLSGAK
jgi:hypothetical protein